VCKLLRSLYGLKQAPRIWSEHLRQTLLALGFTQSLMDPSLYYLTRDGSTIYVLDWVDDMLIGGKSSPLIVWFKGELAKQYKDMGVNMLGERATFEDGSNGLEAGVAEMLTRMQTMRLKVFSHLEEWFEEFRLFHRKDGVIVKLNDDLLSATRYGMMMRRKAKTQEESETRMRNTRAPNVTPFGVFDPVTGY
jgi:hypothetical protein